MGSDDPDSLRGPAPSSVCFEEAAFHRKEAWHEVVRPNLIPKKAPALFIGTPKGYNWFYDLEEKAKRDAEWGVWHYTIYDNPHLDQAEIENARKSCDTEAIWRQEYMAEYESSVGRVFSAFSDERHVRKVVLPAGVFKGARAIDWGMRDNTGALWAFIRNRTLYIYREYAQNNMSAPAQAKIIREMTPGREVIEKNAISHDAAKEDPAMKGLTVLWHFRQAGITPIKPSSRDKKHSRAMIQQLLHENRLVIDSQNCSKLRNELLAYEWKDTAMEKPDDMGNDDLIDALHYLVELLQFDLFLGKSSQNELSVPEIMAAIAAEKIEQQKTLKLTIPSIYRREDAFGNSMEDTPAGYI